MKPKWKETILTKRNGRGETDHCESEKTKPTRLGSQTKDAIGHEARHEKADWWRQEKSPPKRGYLTSDN